jgi:hypothetical protein
MIRFTLARTATMLLGTLLAASLSQAAIVTYSTSGSFDGGGSVKTIGVGADALTLTFAGISFGSVDANPSSFASLGFIDSSSTSSTKQDLSGIDLQITITQHIPGPGGSDILAAVLTGKMSGTSSTGTIDFGGIQAVTIDGIEYATTASSYALVPLSADGRVSIQGLITAQQREVVPEPGTTLLLGSGFALIALVGRKLRCVASV